ncbi:unnamed protein product, partial [Rotaria sp. Silwood2]
LMETMMATTTATLPATTLPTTTATLPATTFPKKTATDTNMISNALAVFKASWAT